MAALFLKSTTRTASNRQKERRKIFNIAQCGALGSLRKINWSFPVMKLVNFQGSIEMKRDEN